MKKRRVVYAAWLALACMLYFFENDTGTRIVLALSLLLPLFPAIRRGLFGPDEAKKTPRPITQSVKSFSYREEDEPGEVRPYWPGDPVRWIHWKLSAKRDELFVRERAGHIAARETEKKAVSPEGRSIRLPWKKCALLTGLFLILLSVILLFAVPAANRGAQALMNRLFDASEKVNAYAYDRFPVPPDQPTALAAALLTAALLALLGVAAFSGSRLMALGLAAGCVLFQVYFGLSFPACLHALLFALFALCVMKRPWEKRTVLSFLAGAAALALAVLLLWPGVDGATEAASETVRDRLSQIARQTAGETQAQPAGETETRHTHTQSLAAGDQEARTGKEYRLVTVEEERISMPRWISYLRIVLLLLLTVLLPILPFLPFLLLNRRRKKAQEAREAFQSEPVNEAVAAIFQQVIAWLEATGNGEGNLPYCQWEAAVAQRFSPEYAARFGQCEKLFEEAAYSRHEMREEQRGQAMALLNETEEMLQATAGWKQRLRLKYRECLWV